MDILAHRRSALPCTMGVYAVTHVVHGPLYVGSSVNLRQRCLWHRSELQRGAHHNVALQVAWNSDGSRAFRFNVLDYVDDPDDLVAAERVWVAVLCPPCNGTTPVARPTYSPAQPGTLTRVRVHSLHQIDLLARARERFWAQVDRATDAKACWLWTGATRSFGSGVFSIRVMQRWISIASARFSYLLEHGTSTDGLFVCHNCPAGDNPACVNPAHLWLGTSAENARDRHAKGRDARGDRNGHRVHPERYVGRMCGPYNPARGDRHSSRTHPERIPRGDRHGARLHPQRWRRGEAVNTAKLTPDEVRTIRVAFAAGGVSKAALGRAYGVSAQNILDVVRRTSWAHVD